MLTMVAHGKRMGNVVDGQFEDPDDEAEQREPKRQKSSQSPPAPPPKATDTTVLNQEIVQPTQTMVAKASMETPPLAPIMTPFPVPPVQQHPMMAAMQMMMNPIAMAQWHQQQALMMHIFSTQMSQPALGAHTSSPNAVSMPSSHHSLGGESVLQNAAASNDTTNKSTLDEIHPWAKENEWRIPFSHNYHPRTGYINPPKDDANDNDDESTHESNDGTVATLDPPPNLPPLDLESISKEMSKFPVVLEDKDFAFGITDWELTKRDVLCGRGGLTNSHPGNRWYRELGNSYRWHYGTSIKSKKIEVAKLVLRKVREQYGRFLKKHPTNDCWYEIGDEMALQKTSQTLREGLGKLYRGALQSKMTVDPKDAS